MNRIFNHFEIEWIYCSGVHVLSLCNILIYSFTEGKYLLVTAGLTTKRLMSNFMSLGMLQWCAGGIEGTFCVGQTDLFID